MAFGAPYKQQFAVECSQALPQSTSASIAMWCSSYSLRYTHSTDIELRCSHSDRVRAIIR